MYILGGVVIVLVVLYGWYASIIGRRNKTQEALATIDVQLQQRSDLIPNILKIAKKFLEHEKELITEITRLRSKVDETMSANDTQTIEEHFVAANQLAGKMGQLMVQVENYPDLKSDATMLQAQQTYNEVEAQIAAARRFYNSAVNNLRNSIQVFPGNILASAANVSDMPMYEALEAARQPVDASDFLD